MPRPTTEVTAKVYGMYIGQKVQVRRKNDADKDYLIGRICEVTLKSNHGDWIRVWFDDVHEVTNQNWETSTSNAHTFFFGEDECKLLLRPLKDITDKDAIEVANLIYHNQKESNVQGKELADHIREIINDKEFDFLKEFTSGAFQYLQSRGYDLPNYLLDGKTLIESGLALDITKP